QPQHREDPHREPDDEARRPQPRRSRDVGVRHGTSRLNPDFERIRRGRCGPWSGHRSWAALDARRFRPSRREVAPFPPFLDLRREPDVTPHSDASTLRLAVRTMAALFGLLIVVGWAQPVLAHATLIETVPADGAQLDESPPEVIVR